MLVRGVLGEHVAVGGALEGLEARLALDGESGHVLFETVVSTAGQRIRR